jgi:hypothetical protein
MSVFVNLDGLEICVMSTLTIVTLILAQTTVNALMTLTILSVIVNKALLDKDVNTKSIIVKMIHAKMVEVAQVLRLHILVNADQVTMV